MSTTATTPNPTTSKNRLLFSLVCYATIIPLIMEPLELIAGFAFHATYAKDEPKTGPGFNDSPLMQANLAWLVVATLWLISRRFLIYTYFRKTPEKDLHSYFSINRRFDAAWDAVSALPETNGEVVPSDAVLRRVDELKLIDMGPQWVHLVVSSWNIIVTGLCHIRYGITGWSAATQTPSDFIVCWTIIVFFFWNRTELLQTEPPVTAPLEGEANSAAGPAAAAQKSTTYDSIA